MSEVPKRPILVWIIFIWFVVSGLLAIYKFYTIAAGTAVIPEGMERPSGVLYYIKAFGFQLLAIASAVLLFLRIEISKWLFLAFLVLSALSGLYTMIFVKLPEQQATVLIITTVVVLRI